MCTLLLAPRVNPIAINKYIVSCIPYTIAGDAEAELQDKCCRMGAQQ